MDYFVLWVVKKLFKLDVKESRIILGSLLGGAFSCLIVFAQQISNLLNIGILILLGFAIIYITFQPKGLKEGIKLFIALHMTIFCIGGMGFALFYTTKLGYIIQDVFIYNIYDFPVKILIISSIVSYICIRVFLLYLKNRNQRHNQLYSVKVHYNDQEVEVIGLLDTGNTLYDPLSNQPVLIVEAGRLNKILPEEIKNCFKDKNINLSEMVTTIASHGFSTRFRMIPFNAIGVSNGMLMGFKPDWIEINYQKQRIPLKNIVIGVYGEKLSQDDAYQMLLHPDILEQCIS